MSNPIESSNRPGLDMEKRAKTKKRRRDSDHAADRSHKKTKKAQKALGESANAAFSDAVNNITEAVTPDSLDPAVLAPASDVTPRKRKKAERAKKANQALVESGNPASPDASNNVLDSIAHKPVDPAAPATTSDVTYHEHKKAKKAKKALAETDNPASPRLLNGFLDPISPDPMEAGSLDLSSPAPGNDAKAEKRKRKKDKKKRMLAVASEQSDRYVSTKETQEPEAAGELFPEVENGASDLPEDQEDGEKLTEGKKLAKKRRQKEMKRRLSAIISGQSHNDMSTTETQEPEATRDRMPRVEKGARDVQKDREDGETVKVEEKLKKRLEKKRRRAERKRLSSAAEAEPTSGSRSVHDGADAVAQMEAPEDGTISKINSGHPDSREHSVDASGLADLVEYTVDGARKTARNKPREKISELSGSLDAEGPSAEPAPSSEPKGKDGPYEAWKDGPVERGLFPFYTQTVSQRLPIFPYDLQSPLEGLIDQHVRPLLKHWVNDYKGVLLGWRNARLGEHPGGSSVSGQVALESVDDYAAAFGWLTLDVDLFKPWRGATMEGSINLQTEGHIGLVCWEMFNASIEAARLPKGWRWTSLPGNSPNDKPRDRGRLGDGAGAPMPAPVDDLEEEDDVSALNTTACWVDDEGQPVRGKLRFRIKTYEVGQTFEYTYLSIEGTMLDPEDEEEMIREEFKRERGRKLRNRTGLRGYTRRQPGLGVTKFGADEDQPVVEIGAT